MSERLNWDFLASPEKKIRPENERLQILYDYFVQRKKDGLIRDHEDEMYEKAKSLGLNHKAAFLLCHVLFDQDILNQIEKYSRLLRHFTLKRMASTNRDGQRYLLGGLEQIFEKYESDLLPKACRIIDLLHIENVVFTEPIYEWATNPQKTFVSDEMRTKILKSCEPILKWIIDMENDSEADDHI